MCRRLWNTSRPHLTVPGVQEGQREACGVRQAVVSQQQAEGRCRIGAAARHALPRLRMRLRAPARSDGKSLHDALLHTCFQRGFVPCQATCKHMQRKHQVGCQPRTSAAARAAAGCCRPLPALHAAPRCAAASRAAGRLRLPRSAPPAARLLQWRRLPQQACLIMHVFLALHRRMQQGSTTMCTLISVTVSLPEIAFQWLPVVWADLRAAVAACEQPAFPGAPPQLAEPRSSRCPVAQPTPEPAQPPLGLQPSRGLGTPQPTDKLLQHSVGYASHDAGRASTGTI